MLSEHSMKQHDLDLGHVHYKLLQMGGLVERRVHDALQCFCVGDGRAAEQLMQATERVDSLEVPLDNACPQLSLRGHTASEDLRTVMTIVRVIVHLEQVSDEAVKIARAARDLPKRWGVAVNYYEVVRVITGCAESMLHDAIDALARLDARQAVNIIAQYREMENEFRSVMQTLTTFMMEDTHLISSALNTMWVAKAAERIGDHAKNIAEYVVYVVDGRDIGPAEDVASKAN